MMWSLYFTIEKTEEEIMSIFYRIASIVFTLYLNTTMLSVRRAACVDDAGETRPYLVLFLVYIQGF